MFSNGEYESFRFKVYPEMADRYIQLIAQDVVKGAESLGNDLLESLNLNKEE